MRGLRTFSIALAVLVLAPLIILVLSSFTTARYVSFPPVGFGFSWYAKAFASEQFRAGLRTSAYLAVIVAPLATCLGSLAAFGLVRYRVPGKEVITTFLMAPLLLPTVVVGMMLLNYFASTGSRTTFLNIVAGQTLLATPYVIRLTLAALQGTDARLEAAAQSLGATPVQAVRLATLPIILPSLIAGAAFAFIVSFDDISVSLFLSRPGTTTLPAFVFNYAEQTSDPLVAAISGLMIGLAVLFLVIIERTIGVGKLFGS